MSKFGSTLAIAGPLTIVGPRRIDLSGLPYGFLLMWAPRDYPLKWQPEYEILGPDGPVKHGGFWFHDAPSKFAPIICAWSVSIWWLPWWKRGGVIFPRFKFAVGRPA